MTRATCPFCGFDFDASAGSHGCPESKSNSRLVDRLREDHRDTVECEHGFLLHHDTCPNVVCLGRDLREAADRIEALEAALLGLTSAVSTMGQVAELAPTYRQWSALAGPLNNAVATLAGSKMEKYRD